MENHNKKENPENSFDFVVQRYREGWFDPGKAWTKFALEKGVKVVIMRPAWIRFAAAAVVLMVLVGGWYGYQHREITVRADVAESKALYLPDNSLATLSENSEVRYSNWDFNRNERALTMKGKVSFDVTKDKTKAFIVHTGNARIEVLGTRFEVSSGETGTDVFVSSGRVSFRSGDLSEESILTAGMHASFGAGKMQVDFPEKGVVILPKEQVLKFNNTPLNIVIQQLNNYYHVTINYQSPATPLFLTATFEKMSLDEILEIISETLDVELKVKS